MSIDAGIDDIIAGGAAAFQFENVGDTCKGTVVTAKTKQQTDLDTGAPKFFANGEPQMQVVITVQRDDGEESALYFKGGKYEVAEGRGQSSLDALRSALNGQKIAVGGTLAMQFSGFGKKKKAGQNAPKLYVCQYQPPALSVDPSDSLI